MATEIPSKYTDLLDYVQLAPDQAETGTCLYVASTGALELIANKKAGITNPEPYGRFDLSESFAIVAPERGGKNFLEVPANKFNIGYGISIQDWPFDAWTETEINTHVWDEIDMSGMAKVQLPKVAVSTLFMRGADRWAMNVLSHTDIQKIKSTLVKTGAPVIVNYNHNRYWHVVVIVGYDDNLPGDCFQISKAECGGPGSFYVRDSFGVPVEVRDYDWFRLRGNAAVSIKEAP